MSGRSDVQPNRDRIVLLGFLLLAYTLSFVDTSIIGNIGRSIKLDIVLTDARLGVFGGLAFALLFVVSAIGLGAGRPFAGWSVDRRTSVRFADLPALGSLHAGMETLPDRARPLASSRPAGVVPAGVAEDVAARCLQASALGTRRSILVW
jgi:hypothetical protein